MKDMSDYYDKQLKKLAIARENLTDQYNSLDNPYQETDYKKILHADLQFTPKKDETILSYATRIKIDSNYNAKKNIQSHINGPKGAWYTHRNPGGCFMCEDTNLISVLVQALLILAENHPELRF